MEMVATIVHQLTRNLSMAEIEKCGFANSTDAKTAAVRTENGFQNNLRFLFMKYLKKT